LAREAREALQLAAVIGREFTVRLLDRLAGLPEGLDGTLAELRTLELIRQKAWFPELSYLFKHALTHEVTYGTLLDERRRALHRLVAQAIEDVYADRIAEHVEQLAHHWSVAEEWPKALGYLEQAAENAADAFANDVASSFYEQAIAAAARCGAVDRQLALYQRLGDLCLYVGDLPRALDVLTRMADVGAANDRPTERALALVYRGDVRGYSHDVEGAIADFRAAADLEGAELEPRLLAALGLSNIQWIFGRFEESRASGDLIRALDDRTITHPRVVIRRLSSESVRLRWQGRFNDYLSDTERELPTSSDLLQIAAIAWMRGIALAETGRFEAALDELHRLLKRLTEIGEQLFYARSLNTIGWVHLELGDLAGSIEWNERCLSFLADSSIPDEEIESNARLNLAEARFSLGDLDAMDRELGRVHEITAGQSLRDTWMMWRFLQRLHLLRAEREIAHAKPADAAAHLAECLALATDSESRKYLVKHAREHARHLFATRELEGADQEAARALELATALGHPSEEWRALALLAQVADARGDVEGARHHRSRADQLLAGIEASLSDSAGRVGIGRLRTAL
jgi:tetratricopeptide (TPR) repeat protein